MLTTTHKSERSEEDWIGTLADPVDPEWMVSRDHYDPAENGFWESLLALTSASLGMRPCAEPTDDSATCGSFWFSLYGRNLVVPRELVLGPALDHHALIVDGRQIALGSPYVLAFRQALDLKRALVSMTVEADLGDVRIRWLRVVAVPLDPGNEVLSLSRVTADRPCAVTLAHLLTSPQGNGYLGGTEPRIRRHHFDRRSCRRFGPGVDQVTWTGAEPGLRWDLWRHTVSNGTQEWLATPRDVVSSVRRDLDAGTSLWSLRRLDVRHRGSPFDASAFRKRFAEHVEDWATHWAQPCVELDGPAEDVLRLRYAQFALRQAAGVGPAAAHGELWNVAARGLTSQYHSGHLFFNSELYLVPYYGYSQPDAAGRLVMHRVRTLAAAERLAGRTGHIGARYPEEADLAGDEAAPTTIVDVDTGRTHQENSGAYVRHNSALVIWALSRHRAQSGLVDAQALPMVVSIGRYLHDLLVRDASEGGQTGVRQVMGFDEFHYPVDHHYATNYLVAWALRQCADLVVGIAPDVSDDEIERWRDAASRVRLPPTGPGGVLQQSDGFFGLPDRVLDRDPARYLNVALTDAEREAVDRLASLPNQLVKQSDCTLLMALLPDRFGAATKLATWRYYNDRTMHDSSLSLGPSALVGFLVGETDEALRQWRACMDYNLRFEPRRDYRNGVHVAGYAGGLLAVIEGASGVRFHGDRLTTRPRLPAGWRKLVLRLHHRGTTSTLTVTDGGARWVNQNADERVIRPAEGGVWG